MKLQEVFDQFTYGELSQVNIGGGANGEISEDNWRSMATLINLGLTAIYKRFNLKTGELVLRVLPGEYVYLLQSRFAVSNTKSKETDRYIVDTALNPFKDDILKIESVKTKGGIGLSLNSGSHGYVCTTPSQISVGLPKALVDGLGSPDLPDYLKNTTELVIGYRANHFKLTPDIGSFDPLNLELELPETYLYALCLFVAARVLNPIGLSNELVAGNTYSAKYEAECVRLQFENLETDKGAPEDKIARNGWK